MATSNKDNGSGEARTIPTFAVRFESRDDFLVEYSDQLRHGLVRLPRVDPLPRGTEVRIRLHLPDGSRLFLTGAVTDAGPDGTKIKLDKLQSEQRAGIERCVHSVADTSSTGEFAAMDEDAEPISVLLVDDSVSQRIEVGDALRARGCRVRVAENGLLALAQALKRPPDVILTDVEMPQMDGWALLRSIRRRKRLSHVPVVFLTRLSDELSRLRGYRLGVDDFLPKTMPADEVLARVHGVMTRRRQMPALTDSHGLRGDLEHVRLGSLLSFLEAERRSGVLVLEDGSDSATLHIRAGALAGVDNLGRFHHDHDRVFELLSWRGGHFEFRADRGPDDGTATSTKAESDTSLSYLLIEHARRVDEAGEG